jgi:hypothetical protein
VATVTNLNSETLREKTFHVLSFEWLFNIFASRKIKKNKNKRIGQKSHWYASVRVIGQCWKIIKKVSKAG